MAVLLSTSAASAWANSVGGEGRLRTEDLRAHSLPTAHGSDTHTHPTSVQRDLVPAQVTKPHFGAHRGWQFQFRRQRGHLLGFPFGNGPRAGTRHSPAPCSDICMA